jgi:hypothetical protein
MDLQQLAAIDPLLKHPWPDIGSMFELHWRDTAVFVSLSSRTNTRWGVLGTLITRSQDRVGASSIGSKLLGLVAQLVRARA